MSQEKIGMLLRTDRCLGCQSCQVACRQVNGFGYDEMWLESVRRKPQMIDGKRRMYHLVAPALDKCTECYYSEEKPLCVSCCCTECLHVGPLDALLAVREAAKGKGQWELVI